MCNIRFVPMRKALLKRPVVLEGMQQVGCFALLERGMSFCKEVVLGALLTCFMRVNKNACLSRLSCMLPRMPVSQVLS